MTDLKRAAVMAFRVVDTPAPLEVIVDLEEYL